MGVAAGEQPPAQTGKREEGVLSAVGLTSTDGKTKEWNTKNLSSRMGVDAVCAAASAGLVAPLIMIVDKCVPPNTPQQTGTTQHANSTEDAS